MALYKFSNIDITKEKISADVSIGQYYMMRITDDILHIKYTKLDNDFYQAFQDVAIEALGEYDGEYEESSNIINFNDYIKNRS